MKASDIHVGQEYAYSNTSNEWYPGRRGDPGARVRVLELRAPFDRHGRYRHTGGTGTRIAFLNSDGTVRQVRASMFGDSDEVVDQIEVVQNRSIRMLWSEYEREMRAHRKAERENAKRRDDAKARIRGQYAELLRILDERGVRRPESMRRWFVADDGGLLETDYFDRDEAQVPHDAEQSRVKVDIGWLVEVLGGNADPDAEPADDDLDDVEMSLAAADGEEVN